MKKCARCGKEYSDEVTACPADGTALGKPTGRNTPLRLAINSLILGVLSLVPFFTTPIMAIAAIIWGHRARAQIRKAPSDKSGYRLALGGLITGYIGIGLTVFVAWSLWSTVQEYTKRINCTSKLKSVAFAARLWAGDHNDVLPKSFQEMSNELNNAQILICPSDKKHNYDTQNPWSSTNISYEFLAPGAAEDTVSNKVVFRCPIHGFEALGDGTVRDGKLKP